MEKFKKYLPLIDGLLEEYSGSMKNENIWAMGSNTVEETEIHALNVGKLDNLCAKLEGIKLFIETGVLPGNDTENTDQKISYLLESLANIIKNEEVALKSNCSELKEMFEIILYNPELCESGV